MAKLEYPEPVPAATQLALLPFLSAIQGVLSEPAGNAKLRITFHRIIARETHGYIQQACTYLGSVPNTQSSVGRMFALDTGIMGSAILKVKILRTRRYESLDRLRADLRQDLIDTADARDVMEVPVSYLAIPVLGGSGDPALCLYAECDSLNFFSDDARLNLILSMCSGFCRLIDWLDEKKPFDNLRNFPLEPKEFKRGLPTVFRRLQEEVDRDTPQFHSLESFNFDTSVA